MQIRYVAIMALAENGKNLLMIEKELINSHLFAQLNEKQLAKVCKHAVRKKLKAGDFLFDQGDVADRFYYVVGGQIKLFRATPKGSEKVIEVVTPGSTFAEAMMFLDRSLYPVGAQALTDADVISINSANFAAMLKESVDTCFLLLGDMSQRLRGLLREIDELSQYSAISRVAAYLLQTATPESDSFELPVPKQVLASRLSVKPETLSRTIKQLVDNGIISIKGGRVDILSRDELKQTAEACAVLQDQLHATFLYPCEPGK